MKTTAKRAALNIKLPFDRPEPIKPESITDFDGFRLSQDENPAKFVIRARYVMEFSLFKCFKTEQEAWREAAYWAAENGFDPSPFTVETLTGKTKARDRQPILERFRHGQTRVLIGRANMLGYGMNFQHCGSMIFNGWNFSYESFYQALRRAYRHGQTRRLRVHIPIIPELEGQMWNAIGRKQRQHEASIAEMETNYIRAMRKVLLPDGRAA